MVAEASGINWILVRHSGAGQVQIRAAGLKSDRAGGYADAAAQESGT